MNKKLTQTSKFLSLILRHKPEILGIKLDDNGWADLDEIIKKSTNNGQVLDMELIQEVVEENDKKRFIISADGKKIRANQGHSIEVDLGLEKKIPPDILYHGTATRFLDSIMGIGLKPGNRQHVHLSGDVETAINVGQRHGKSVILEVDCKKMVSRGRTFFLSANGVWLTDFVNAEFLAVKNL